MNSEERLSRLLSAERAEQPSGASFERGLHSLRASLGGGAAGPPIAHGPLKLGLSLAAKWSLGSGLLVLAALSAGSAVSSRLAASSAPAARVVTQLAAATAAEPERSPVSVEPSPAASAPPPPSAALRLSSGPVAGASSFTEELKLIKASKQALDAGRLDSAAALLNEHARLYPAGVFRGERQALSVLLECRRSAPSGAAAAQRFVAQQPSSPFVDCISRACGLGPSAPATALPAAPPGSAPAADSAANANFPELGK